MGGSGNLPDPLNAAFLAPAESCECFPGGSPSLIGAPAYNSRNPSPSPWGFGWNSDNDQTIAIQASGSLIWTTSTGAQLTFFVAVSTAGARYIPPLNTAFSMSVSSASGSISAAVERDPDGTARKFSVFDSTSLLRLASLTDRNGNTVTYSRDSQGRLTRVSDVHGRYFSISYNGQGQVSSLNDSAGRTTTYTYDGNGNRSQESGALGTIKYTYDSNHRITQISYPNGGVKNYAYDSQGRVISQDDASGNNRLTFDYGTNSTTVTDALGRQTVYQYTQRQGLRKPTQITDANGGITTFEYDANFNLTKWTDPNGHATTYGHDANGNITLTQDAQGGQSSAAYDLTFNNPLQATDPNGNTTRMGYDAHGNLTQITDPLSVSSYLTPDSYGHVGQVQDGLANTTRFTYDPATGALASATDPLNRTLTFENDDLSQVTKITDPAAHSTSFAYDLAGDLTRAEDAAGHVTRYSYVTGRNDMLPSQITDALGHTTSFTYDKLDRLTSVANALNQSGSVAYDAVGRPVTVTMRGGQKLSFTYDKLDRLTQLAAPDGSINYTYDAAGNVTSISRSNGSSTQLTYDSLNRVTQSIQTLPGGGQFTLGYTYDAGGNLTQMTTPWGSFTYTYGPGNRLSTIQNPFAQTITFTYDALGRRTAMTYPNGTATSYSYDAAGQVSRVLHYKTVDQSTIAFTTYQYDNVGNRTSVTDIHGTHSYTYDSLSQLTAASHPSDTTLPTANESFAYDPLGNRLSDAERTGYTYDAANRIVSDSSFTYTSDANGSITSRTSRSDGTTTSFHYDSSNALVGVDGPSGTIATYKYDGTGNRVERNVGGAITRYVYDGARILAILDSNNKLVSLLTDGPGVDSPLIMRKGGQDYFFHADAQGNVDALTDSIANIAETYEYQAFGHPVARGPAGNLSSYSFVGNPFLYASREFDPETGLYFLRARYYDSDVGRFLQEDPIPDLNQYAYASDNPVLLTDPLGLTPTDSPVINAVGGFGNGLAFGLGGVGKEAIYDQCSKAFRTAQAIGRAVTTTLILDGIGAAVGGLGGTTGSAEVGLSFSQKTASPIFDIEGEFAGNTISDVAAQLRAGLLAPSEVPIEVVNIEGNNLIVNTRSALALRQAGVPQSLWKIVPVSDSASVARMTQRLAANELTNAGTDVLTITGYGKNASTLIGRGAILGGH